jgi:REP element-mobilizing transposase RayT
MANTFFSIHYHIVFSTKARQRFLRGETRQRVLAYLGGITKENDARSICIGGTEDYVHLLVEIPPKHAVSKLVQQIKGGSSKWIHDTFGDLRAFAWQDGYSVFAVSKSGVREVIHYVENQEEHHRQRTFGEELRLLLERHEISYDERYLFD